LAVETKRIGASPSPRATTAAGHTEHCNFTHHAPITPPRISTTSGSGAGKFSEG
jgi:hypothetical protein